jgi:hypothetical protein
MRSMRFMRWDSFSVIGSPSVPVTDCLPGPHAAASHGEQSYDKTRLMTAHPCDMTTSSNEVIFTRLVCCNLQMRAGATYLNTGRVIVVAGSAANASFRAHSLAVVLRVEISQNSKIHALVLARRGDEVPDDADMEDSVAEWEGAPGTGLGAKLSEGFSELLWSGKTRGDGARYHVVCLELGSVMHISKTKFDRVEESRVLNTRDPDAIEYCVTQLQRLQVGAVFLSDYRVIIICQTLHCNFFLIANKMG